MKYYLKPLNCINFTNHLIEISKECDFLCTKIFNFPVVLNILENDFLECDFLCTKIFNFPVVLNILENDFLVKKKI